METVVIRFPFVMRWQLDLSEQRRISERDAANKEADRFRERLNEAAAERYNAVAACGAAYEARIADLLDHLVESRATATENRRLYETMVDGCLARDAKHVEDLAALQAQHHELAMHPPTGILTGPQALSPLAAFGPKTQEAIKAMSAGLGKANRDAMIAKAFEQKAAGSDDDVIANAIYRGESSETPKHMRS